MIGFAFTTASPRVAPLGRSRRPGRQQPAGVGAAVARGGCRHRIDRRRRGLPVSGYGAERGGRQPFGHLPPSKRAESGGLGARSRRRADHRSPMRRVRVVRTRRSATTRVRGWPLSWRASPSFLSGAAFDDQRQATGGTNHWFAAYDVRQFVSPEPVHQRGARHSRPGAEQSAATRFRPGVCPGRPGEYERPALRARWHPPGTVHPGRTGLGRRAHGCAAAHPSPSLASTSGRGRRARLGCFTYTGSGGPQAPRPGSR